MIGNDCFFSFIFKSFKHCDGSLIGELLRALEDLNDLPIRVSIYMFYLLNGHRRSVFGSASSSSGTENKAEFKLKCISNSPAG